MAWSPASGRRSVMVTACILVGGMNVGQSDTLGELLFANVNASLTCLGTERFAPFSEISLRDYP
jgi:hypothetical protein